MRTATQFSPGSRRRYRASIGGFLACLLLGALMYKTKVHAVYREAASIPIGSVLLMAFLIYLSVPLRVFQWQLLLPSEKGVKFRYVLHAQCLGYLGNSLLPFGGGEFLKTGYLAETASVPFTETLGSVLIMRLQDVLPVVILVLAGATLTADSMGPAYHETVRFAIPSAIIAAGAAISGIVVLYARGAWLARIFSRAAPLISKRLARRCNALVRPFLEGLDAVGHPVRLLVSQLFSLVCWCLFTVAPVPLLIALGLETPVALRCAIALTGLANLAQLAPITPAGLGTYHVLCMLVVSTVCPELSYDMILAFALVSHAIGAAAPALLGVVSLPWAWARLEGAAHRGNSPDELTCSNNRIPERSEAAPVGLQRETLHDA